MIIKLYITLGYIVTIDNVFVNSLPKQMVENAVQLNQSKVLVMGPDQNSMKKIWSRLQRHHSLIDILCEGVNLGINLWYAILTNFQIIAFNYFAAFIGVFIQFIGYRAQMKTEVS